MLAKRSQDPSATYNWDWEVWPFETDSGGWIVHCLASFAEGETIGSEFHSS